jgi:hypothetical protein
MLQRLPVFEQKRRIAEERYSGFALDGSDLGGE